MQKSRLVLAVVAGATGLFLGCEDGPFFPTPEPAPVDPGALVSVSLDGKVGVLLDEMPESMRGRVAESLIGEPEGFWIARAREQVRLTSLRLDFRQFFYPPEDAKLQLPIPPEQVLSFELDAEGPKRTTIDGHDAVVVDYHLQSYLVTMVGSPEKSEPALGTIGGTWDELFVFPLDPTLILERTGYACLSESGLPPQSVDTENAHLFYNHTCEVELPTALRCHLTQPGPDETCQEALERAIGRVPTALRYERVAWDEAIAAAHRVGGITQPDYPDLDVREDFLERNNIVYRYFPADHCALQEKCVGGPGWRRLLQFDTVDENIGGQPLNIGAVDYYLAGGDPQNALHGMYEFSACHQHYHFMHYGNFSLEADGETLGYKPGFCLQSTDRLSNHEMSPMHNPYGSCAYQGIDVGWADKYQAGLPCQWIDITDMDVNGSATTATLSFHSNPDRFLCEGSPVLGSNGEQTWEATEFETADGQPVDRPVCELFDGWDANAIGEVPVSIPKTGGVTTLPCTRNQVGPNRNCEFSEKDDTPLCTAGAEVTLACTVANAEKPQVVRICDHSFALDQGVACSAHDARATKVVDGADIEVTFTCPERRDDVEQGGRYAIFTAPVWNADGESAVTCVP